MLSTVCYEEFEYNKWVIRMRKSKSNRKRNGSARDLQDYYIRLMHTPQTSTPTASYAVRHIPGMRRNCGMTSTIGCASMTSDHCDIQYAHSCVMSSCC